MPTNTGKLRRYVPTKIYENPVAEQIFNDLVEHAAMWQRRGLHLTLLADDFIDDASQKVFINTLTPNSLTPYHNHDFYEINYVVSGSCVQYINGNALYMEAGDFLFMSPPVFHASFPVGQSDAVNILLRTDWLNARERKMAAYDADNYLSALTQRNMYSVFRNTSAGSALQTGNALAAIRNQHAYPNAAYGKLYAEILAEKLLLELSVCARFDMSGASTTENATAELAERILQYIRDNYTSITLESAAEHFGYSSAHMSRIIKSHTGCGFAAFLTSYRFTRAKALLAESVLPIGQIAKMVGLDSKEYFSRMFKKQCGMTPFEYRKTRRK